MSLTYGHIEFGFRVSISEVHESKLIKAPSSQKGPFLINNGPFHYPFGRGGYLGLMLAEVFGRKVCLPRRLVHIPIPNRVLFVLRNLDVPDPIGGFRVWETV